MNRRLFSVPLLALIAAATLSACTAQRTPEAPTSLRGDNLAVAESVAGLSKDASRFALKNVCSRYLSSRMVTAIRRSSGKTCEQALRGRIAQGDRMDLTTKRVTIKDGKATAVVTTDLPGKDNSAEATLTLIKNAGRWQVDDIR